MKNKENITDIQYLRFFFAVPEHISDTQICKYIDMWKQKNGKEAESNIKGYADGCLRKLKKEDKKCSQ